MTCEANWLCTGAKMKNSTITTATPLITVPISPLLAAVSPQVVQRLGPGKRAQRIHTGSQQPQEKQDRNQQVQDMALLLVELPMSAFCNGCSTSSCGFRSYSHLYDLRLRLAPPGQIWQSNRKSKLTFITNVMHNHRNPCDIAIHMKQE